MKINKIENEDEFGKSKVDYLESIASKINEVEQLILKIEKQKTIREKESIIRNLMSIVHSIKGSSAAFEFSTIASICHTVEDITINLQNHVTHLSESVINELLAYNDLIRKYSSEYIKNGFVDEKRYAPTENSQLHKELVQPNNNCNHLFSVRILCVGNIKTFIKSFAERINGVKIEARYVEDGLDALNLVAKEHFDFLITSKQISTINGLPLIAVIKQMSLGTELVTILLTSESTPLDSSITNPDYVILKNLNFHDKLQDIFKSRIQANITFAANKVTTKYSEIKKIIYIDDDEEVIKLVQILFRRNPQYEVKYIVDSKKAESEIKAFLPDIILTDLNMPKLDGLSLLKDLRQNEELQKIPVVFITGETNEHINKELTTKGAFKVLNKSQIMKELPEFLAKTKIITA